MNDTSMGRRGFLGALAVTGGALMSGTALAEPATNGMAPGPNMSWPDFRKLFPLRPDRIHMACMVMTSHPEPVTRAIEMHRAALQNDPVRTSTNRRWHLEKQGVPGRGALPECRVRRHRAADSTSMGSSFLYTGMKLKPGDEILTTIHDHFSTEMAIAECAARTGCTVQRIAMFDDPATASESEMIDPVRRAISPKTRVVGRDLGSFLHRGEDSRPQDRRYDPGAQPQAGREGSHLLLRRRCACAGDRGFHHPRSALRFLGGGHPQMAVRAAWHRRDVGQGRRLADHPPHHSHLGSGIAACLDRLDSGNRRSAAAG